MTDPSTGEVLGVSGIASTEQINRAMAASAAAWKTWRNLSDAVRADHLRECASMEGLGLSPLARSRHLSSLQDGIVVESVEFAMRCPQQAEME